MKFFLYNFILILLLPLMISRLIIRSLKDKDYIKNISNRFGIYENGIESNPVWFHAVSLGEVISSETLIKKILYDNEVVLSVSTPTGYRQAKKIFGNSLQIVYAPWDIHFFVNNFLKKFNPKALIIFETEIWPSMIKATSAKKIPIFLTNARLSQESNSKYSKIKFFLKEVVELFTLVLAQTNKHYDRFVSLGVDKDKIKIVGSIKFDKNNNIEKNKIIVRDPNLILATSTHPGEEEIICKVFKKLASKDNSLKFVLVPRHPERADSIRAIFKKENTNCMVLEEIPSSFDSNKILIFKGIGFLDTLYKSASLAFVGGSMLKAYGGHNIIEASANGCPFIVGPYMKNFEDVISLFLEKDACIQIKSFDELYSSCKKLIYDEELRQNMVDNAYKVVENNRGSVEKQYNYMKEYLN